MVQVESDAIDEIEYEPSRATLFVRFSHGDWYSYFGVPPAIHEAFIAAESHGRYFHEHIRDRYDYRRGQQS